MCDSRVSPQKLDFFCIGYLYLTGHTVYIEFVHPKENIDSLLHQYYDRKVWSI